MHYELVANEVGTEWGYNFVHCGGGGGGGDSCSVFILKVVFGTTLNTEFQYFGSVNIFLCVCVTKCKALKLKQSELELEAK